MMRDENLPDDPDDALVIELLKLPAQRLNNVLKRVEAAMRRRRGRPELRATVESPMADLLVAMAAQHRENPALAPYTMAGKAIDIVSSSDPEMSRLIADLRLTRKGLAERLVTLWNRDIDDILKFQRLTSPEFMTPLWAATREFAEECEVAGIPLDQPISVCRAQLDAWRRRPS